MQQISSVNDDAVGLKLPELMLPGWIETRQLLHIYCQIVGKIRLKLHPKLIHWWHATLSISPVGWTTGPIPFQNKVFDIEMNLIEHMLHVRCSDGQSRSMSLNQPSVSAFHDNLFSCLSELGINVSIYEMPFDAAKVKSHTPFHLDHRSISYDPEIARRLCIAYLAADMAFQTFKGRFKGMSSPVQLFWHSFDLAETFFSGREAPKVPGMDPVSAEAYSHEVISFGFWPGDDLVKEPAFYSYTYPGPQDLSEAALRPPEARWEHQERGTLAILPYEVVRKSMDPKASILEFMESAYQAGINKAHWPLQ